VVYRLWDKIIAAVATAWTTAQLHAWEVQDRPYSGSPPDRPCPADPPTISPSNNSARASVESVCIPLQLKRTPFDDVEGGWAHAAASNVLVSSHSEEPPENALVSFPPKEPPENVRARPQTEESPEAVLAFPLAEALLEPVQVAPLPQEPLDPVFVETLFGALRRDREEEPSESVSLSPRKLLLNAFAVLGSFPLKCLFHLLPSWSRPKWWSVYSHRAFIALYRAPSSTLADTAGISSTWWPLRYNVTTSLCGLFVGCSSRGGTRVPLYLVGDVVVAYKSSPGEAFPTPLGGGRLPLPPLGHVVCHFGTWGLLIVRYFCITIIKMKDFREIHTPRTYTLKRYLVHTTYFSFHMYFISHAFS